MVDLAVLQGRKDEVLRIYDDYTSYKAQYKDNIDPEILEKRAANIRNDKFFLLVAGEAKSGKSTFINAFLGAEILPMDIKQCTSAVIEINYGTDITLEAEYADDRRSFISGQQQVEKFLKEHAAINDDYRAIPVTAINNEILIKSRGHIRKSEVNDLIEGVKDDNIYNLSQDEFEKRVWGYINEKKNKWQDIVIRINVTYPFSEGIRDITIVDSPGVNAAGKVGNITNEYIAKADAIIFVKALTGQSLESHSFRNFLDSNALNRSRGALLLFLTQISDLADDAVFNLKNQAVDMYKGFIKENQITAIDSKMQLFHNRFTKLHESEIDNQFEGKAFPSAETLWYKSGRDRKEVLELLQKESGFKEIGNMLNKFAMKAHYERLRDFLDLIGKGYETMAGKIKDALSVLEKSAEDPAKLKIEIDKKQDEIDEIKTKMQVCIDRINSEYTDHETGLIKRKAEEEFNKFKKEFSSTTGFDAVEKKTLEGQDMFFDFREQVREQLINDCDQQLVEIADKTSISFESVIPRLTKEDFNKLKSETKEKATEDETYTDGCWIFAETRHRSVYSEKKHLNFVKNKIFEALEDTKSRMVSTLQDDVHIVTKTYNEELGKNADIKQYEYTDLLHRMTKAKEIRQEIEILSRDRGIIAEKTQELNCIKGGIESGIN
jgi:GTPase Era involved in 16S rRNA processing